MISIIWGSGLMFREEVLNVVLGDLLNKRGSLNVPEQIIRSVTDSKPSKRLPDIVIADFWGVRIVIEGRTLIGDAEDSLSKDARKRVEEGIAQICIAVLYPSNVREAPTMEDLSNRLSKALLRVRVFSEASDGEWTDSDVDGLGAILRRSYDELVREDVVAAVVSDLDAGIDVVSGGLLESRVNSDRLRKILGIRETERAKEDNE
jgi:hypothetical protein